MKKSTKAVIEDVVIQPNKIQPIIVHFQNGELKDEEASKMKCGLYIDERKNKTVLALSNNQIVYKGYRPEKLSRELTYTMLAIHNKRTGKVRLIQAEHWNVAAVLDEHIENNSDDDTDKVVALNRKFGSKRAKRRTEQYERMQINIDNVKEQLEKTASNVEIEKSDLELISKDDFIDGLHLPPCNREATHVSNVYDIDDIVPKNILKTLYSRAAEVVKSEIENKPAFFIKTVEYAKNDAECTAKIAILLYIESTVKWLNQPIKYMKKDLIVCPDSEEANNYIIESYSVISCNGIRQRPNTMRDKGIIHSIILGLMIWNYTLDLELLSSMFKLRLGIKKLLDLARWIGAVPLKNKFSVTLKLPLPPPVSKPLVKRKKVHK